MPKTHRHYSPEVRRFLVTVLYHEAKAQKVPMTVLTNQLLERSLRGGMARCGARLRYLAGLPAPVTMLVPARLGLRLPARPAHRLAPR